MFKQGDLVVNIPFTTSQVDVVLNALQEKQLMIEELRQDIFDIAKEQIDTKMMMNEGKEKENMESKVIICKDCGKEFEYTVGEQKFYEEKGFPAPSNQQYCRRTYKEASDEYQRNGYRNTQGNLLLMFIIAKTRYSHRKKERNER